MKKTKSHECLGNEGKIMISILHNSAKRINKKKYTT